MNFIALTIGLRDYQARHKGEISKYHQHLIRAVQSSTGTSTRWSNFRNQNIYFLIVSILTSLHNGEDTSKSYPQRRPMLLLQERQS